MEAECRAVWDLRTQQEGQRILTKNSTGRPGKEKFCEFCEKQFMSASGKKAGPDCEQEMLLMSIMQLNICYKTGQKLTGSTCAQIWAEKRIPHSGGPGKAFQSFSGQRDHYQHLLLLQKTHHRILLSVFHISPWDMQTKHERNNADFKNIFLAVKLKKKILKNNIQNK